MKTRLASYSAASTELALLSDKHLAAMLAKATPHATGIGGETASLEIGDTKVFVKKIRLTDLERLPENKMSTANLFELPLFFQYGIGLDSIGSAGFGAWRELAAHVMTTNWVLAGECPNFPLMYHWRILPSEAQIPTAREELPYEERLDARWGMSQAIRARFDAKQKASADIVLFLEHIPETLHNFLSTVPDFEMVERDMREVTAFMSSHGFLHFDAHFRNVLTDGERLYFTDFGLAISDRFELSDEERVFFECHRNYDRALMANCLFNSALPATMLNCYAPIALLMKNFNHAFMSQSKTATYPAEEIAKACAAAGLT